MLAPFRFQRVLTSGGRALFGHASHASSPGYVNRLMIQEVPADPERKVVLSADLDKPSDAICSRLVWRGGKPRRQAPQRVKCPTLPSEQRGPNDQERPHPRRHCHRCGYLGPPEGEHDNSGCKGGVQGRYDCRRGLEELSPRPQTAGCPGDQIAGRKTPLVIMETRHFRFRPTLGHLVE